MGGFREFRWDMEKWIRSTSRPFTEIWGTYPKLSLLGVRGSFWLSIQINDDYKVDPSSHKLVRKLIQDRSGINIHMVIFMFTFVCIYIYINTLIYIRVFKYIYIYTCIYIYIQLYIYKYSFIFTFIYIYIFLNIFVYIYICEYIHIWINSYVYIYIYLFKLSPIINSTLVLVAN